MPSLLQTGFAAGKPFNWFPEIAGSLLGASLLTRIDALFLPAVAVALVLFGYIARIARAGHDRGALGRLHAHGDAQGHAAQPRPAPPRIRNAILPTIAVVATQTGYLFGGLVAIEKFFGYPGIGQLILSAAQIKNFPMLQACVLVVGVIYFGATLLGDILSAALNPRVRLGKSS